MLRQVSTLFSRNGGGEQTLVNYIEEDQVVVERSSLIVSLVYGFRFARSVRLLLSVSHLCCLHVEPNST